MNVNEIYEKIFCLTPSEQWHLENPGRPSLVYDSLRTEIIQDKECYCFNFPNILNGYTVGVLKETRFTDIPFHYHTDMELNYVYSGSYRFVINDKEVTLKQGDLCIVDADVIHNAFYKGEDDIVFNIVFQKKFFKDKFVNWIGDKGILGNFILSSINQSQRHDKYLIFHTDHLEQDQLVSSQLKGFFNLLIQEYYHPSLYKGDLMEHYLSAIFLLLINAAAIDGGNYFENRKDDSAIIKILKYIEENYSNEECRLENIARELHFSQSHLYKLIRKSTNSSFSQLKIKQQMDMAALLLKTTNLPILDISEEVGCKNRTFFYEKFKELYDITPSEYRNMTRRNQS